MGPQKIGQEGGARANPLKIGPRTPPGVHPGQFFTPDRSPAAPGPENGPQTPKTSAGPPQTPSRLQVSGLLDLVERGHPGGAAWRGRALDRATLLRAWLGLDGFA